MDAQTESSIEDNNRHQADSPAADLRYAEHALDLLAILKEKTAGNLDANENSGWKTRSSISPRNSNPPRKRKKARREATRS